MKRLILLLAFLIVAYWMSGQSCKTLPFSYHTYEQAMFAIRQSSFPVSEKITTPRSSWILGAEYYSCDGRKGFFIYKTIKGKEYIMRDMPLQVWQEFKNTDSFGTYYNENIRGKYHFRL